MGKKVTNLNQLLNKNFNNRKNNKQIFPNNNIKLTKETEKLAFFIYQNFAGKHIVLNEREYYGKCFFVSKLEPTTIRIDCKDLNGKTRSLVIPSLRTSLKACKSDKSLFYIIDLDSGEVFDFIRTFDDLESAKLYESLKQLGIGD